MADIDVSVYPNKRIIAKTAPFLARMANTLTEGQGLDNDYMANRRMGLALDNWYKHNKDNYNQIYAAYMVLSDNGADKNFDDDDNNILKLIRRIEPRGGGRKRSSKSTKKRSKKRKQKSRRR